MSLGYGVAYHIRSDELNAIRNDIAEAFGPLLTPQDRAGWRPHVTIQNKTKPDIAKALLARLILEFRERPIDIAGLAAWWYDGGSWQPIAAYRFGGGVPMKHPPPLIAG